MISSKHSASGKLGKAFEEGKAAKGKKEPYNPYRIGTKSRQLWEDGFNS